MPMDVGEEPRNVVVDQATWDTACRIYDAGVALYKEVADERGDLPPDLSPAMKRLLNEVAAYDAHTAGQLPYVASVRRKLINLENDLERRSEDGGVPGGVPVRSRAM